MNLYTALLASFALIAPVPAEDSASNGDTARHSRSEGAAPVAGFDGTRQPFAIFEQFVLPQSQHQVRIEQRVIIRIAPSPPAARAEMLARIPRREMDGRFQEVETDKCVPIGDIAGVAPVQQNRLLLFMRDRRVLSAALDRTCDAQAFYSGFYVERSADGMMCSGRETLQSRAGTSCGVSRFSRLVAIKD